MAKARKKAARKKSRKTPRMRRVRNPRHKRVEEAKAPEAIADPIPEGASTAGMPETPEEFHVARKTAHKDDPFG